MAHSLDSTVSAAAPEPGPAVLAALTSLNASAHGELRAFRFQSPFDEAIYLLDDGAAMLVSGPGRRASVGPPVNSRIAKR